MGRNRRAHMSALRLLLVVAIVAAAKASLADRVVPEEQFYNAATEAEFSNEQATTDATRSDRAAATNTGSSSITTLLETLITNIGNEKTACDTQYAADSKVCTDTHTAALALCEKTHVDELKRLTDDAEEKRAICGVKTDIWQGKKNVMDQEQDFNNMIAAQLSQACESLEYINSHSADELAECQANAAASFTRVSGYINDAFSTNMNYLAEADAMVDSIEGQVADLQAGAGVGTATQYVEPTLPLPL